MSNNIQVLFSKYKQNSICKTKKYVFSLSVLLAMVISSNHANAALSVATGKSIQGLSPRLNAVFESQIQGGHDFGLLGVTYAGSPSFTQSSFASQLALSGLSLLKNKPSDMVISPAFKPFTEGSGIDSNGDIFGENALSEASAGSVNVNWYYLNDQGVETSLTAAQKGITFCDLALQGISPYIRVQGAVVLKTSYGDPREYGYPNASITKIPQHKFAIELNDGVCYATPSMRMASGVYDPNMSYAFNTSYGFIPKSLSPNVLNNFPSVGAKNLNFYLVVSGIKANAPNIQWTATSTPSTSNVRATVSTNKNLGLGFIAGYKANNMVVVTLDGPDKNTAAIGAKAPDFSGPTTIKITATDTSTSPNRVMITYEFQIKNWFVVRTSAAGAANAAQLTTWCSGLGNYTLPTIAHLTNGTMLGINPNNFRRIVGGGLFSEWGASYDYATAGLTGTNYWTTNKDGSIGATRGFLVGGSDGDITSQNLTLGAYAVCRSR